MFSMVLDGCALVRCASSCCTFKHAIDDKAVSVLSGKEAGSRVTHVALSCYFKWAWIDEKGLLTECRWWNPVGTGEKYC